MTQPPRLPPERAGHEAPADLVKFRQGLVGAAAAGAFRTNPPAEEETLGGVRALRYRAAGAPRGVLLHMHGGGFRLGVADMSAHFAVRLAARCQIDVVCLDYRLAPEHPYPAGLADGRAGLSSLQAAGGGPIIVSGDSAGGGLAAGMVALSKDDTPPPAGLVLFSAWLDLTVTSRFFEDNAATDPLFSRAAAEAAADLYLQGVSPRDPLASPAFGSVAGFPPTFISIGEGEVLLEDSLRYRDALESAGSEATLCAVPDMEHTALLRNAKLTGAEETFDALAKFVDRIVM
jgi:monoterpene epsilon-lactone hydrolase